MRAVLVFAAACGTAAAPAPAPVPTPAPGIEAADRTCSADADCTAILMQCSACEGACTGVRVDRADSYAGKLDCKDYHGKQCNYDCQPSFKIEEPRCVSGRCESVRKP